jgi:hypothetical protein
MDKIEEPTLDGHKSHQSQIAIHTKKAILYPNWGSQNPSDMKFYVFCSNKAQNYLIQSRRVRWDLIIFRNLLAFIQYSSGTVKLSLTRIRASSRLE